MQAHLGFRHDGVDGCDRNNADDRECEVGGCGTGHKMVGLGGDSQTHPGCAPTCRQLLHAGQRHWQLAALTPLADLLLHAGQQQRHQKVGAKVGQRGQRNGLAPAHEPDRTGFGQELCAAGQSHAAPTASAWQAAATPGCRQQHTWELEFPISASSYNHQSVFGLPDFQGEDLAAQQPADGPERHLVRAHVLRHGKDKMKSVGEGVNRVGNENSR